MSDELAQHRTNQVKLELPRDYCGIVIDVYNDVNWIGIASSDIDKGWSLEGFHLRALLVEISSVEYIE